MVFGISITNLLYVNSKSHNLDLYLNPSKTSEQQIQKRPQQPESSSTGTGTNTPASIPVAQPEHQRRLKDPQVPGSLKRNDPRPPPPQEERASKGNSLHPLHRTPKTKQSRAHPPKPQHHKATTRQRLHHPPWTTTIIPRSPALRSENKLQHHLSLSVRNWKAL